MKKVYLLGAIMFSGLSVFGQLNSNAYNFSSRKINAPKSIASKPEAKKVKATEKAAGDVLWQESFDTIGGPLTTEKGNWIRQGANFDLWSATSEHPFYKYNPSWISDLDGMFITWNSTSVTEKEPEGSYSTTSVIGSIESPTINLGGIASAILTLETEAYYCCNYQEAPFGISISVDNGGTWSDTLKLDLGIGRGEHSYLVGEPVEMTINMNDFQKTLSNQTKIKLIWDGSKSDSNGQFNTDAYWSVDNIKIIENYNYDVAIEKLWLADMVNDYEYTDIPQNFAGNLTVQAKVRNIGDNTPSSLGVKLEIYDTAGTFITSISKGGVPTNNFSYEYDTITFNTGYELGVLDINMYNVYAIIEMDQADENQTNDTIYRTFGITDFYYGQRDYNQYIVGENYADSDAPNYKPLEIGNVMFIPTDTDIHGLEIRIRNSTYLPTTVGQELVVNFYEYDPLFVQNGLTFADAHVELDPKRNFDITSDMLPSGSDVGKTVILNFHQATGERGPVNLTGGKYYLISVSHAGGTDNSFSYYVNKSDEDFSSHVYGDYSTSPGNSWVVFGEQFISRLVFDASLGINENNTFANVSEVYPNPTTGEAKISYNLDNASNVSVKVVDITGKVVYTAPAENKSAGKHNVNINAASFNSGVYYVTIATEESQVTKKLIRK